MSVSTDLVLFGAGPSCLSCAKYLFDHGMTNFLIYDMGPVESKGIPICGIGGASTFTDGRFAFFRSGSSKVWRLPEKKLLVAYDFLGRLLKNYINVPVLTDSPVNFQSRIKEDVVTYLSESQRLNLLDDLCKSFRDKIFLGAELIGITKVNSVYQCSVMRDGEEITILSKNVILGGGKFMPLFIRDIPFSFKRFEIGIRLEGPSDHEVFSSLSSQIFVDSGFEYRTFWPCLNGSIDEITFKDITIKVGRSDVKTSRSNAGFKIRLSEEYEHLFSKALQHPCFSIKMDQDWPEKLLNCYGSELGQYLINGLQNRFTKFDMSDFVIHGPTVDSLGSYPVTDENLQIADENIWVVGDMTGRFRGIVPGMISGIYVGVKFLTRKPIVICLSGKRFSGKSTAAKILQGMFSKTFPVQVLYFSTLLKKRFCKEYNLDLDLFLNNREYKEKYRDQLVKFCGDNDVFEHTLAAEVEIDKHEFEVYILDGLRCWKDQAEYINKNCLDKWYLKMVRINCKDREKRGFVKTSYDDSYFETDLDSYDGFDVVINNDGTEEEFISQLNHMIFR